MSKSKRLEKEIDYLKSAIGILVALTAGITAWFVNTDSNANLLFQLFAIVLFFIFIFGIIYLHKKVEILFDQLEATND